jgi:hypothetical protein
MLLNVLAVMALVGLDKLCPKIKPQMTAHYPKLLVVIKLVHYALESQNFTVQAVNVLLDKIGEFIDLFRLVVEQRALLGDLNQNGINKKVDRHQPEEDLDLRSVNFSSLMQVLVKSRPIFLQCLLVMLAREADLA